MIGPPGAGKTLLARAMPGILPRMTIEEALDVTRIYSVADQLPDNAPLVRVRPFRAPITPSAMLAWWGVVIGPTRERFLWHIAVCCF